MRVDLNKEDLATLVKGTVPYYDVFDHPLVKKSGHYVGGFHDKWEWHYKFEDRLTEKQLLELYITCKNSWK